jgi:putative DNA primase/helicase
MREDFWEFTPSHKLILCTNHLPQIAGTDHAIWRRILQVPFTVTIAEADQDKTLPDKLRAEYPAILQWMVEGCLEWQRHGLGEPAAVVDATDRYRKQEDQLGSFIGQCCVVDYHARAGATDLFKAYQEFSGDREMTQKRFGGLLAERGFHGDRITAGANKGRMAWFGIGFLAGSEGCEG